MSQRDISKTIEDIYGFSISHEMVSDITDVILPELEERLSLIHILPVKSYGHLKG